MKKSIKNIILLPALALSLSSCTDWLELKPTTQIIEEDMWQNQNDVESVVASCYNAMLSNEFMRRVIVWGELRSDNMNYNRNKSDELSTEDQEMYRSVSLSSITSTDNITSWSAFYNVINICNYVVHYAPNVCNVDPDYLVSEMNANVAEARALRALCYFYLIRTFDRVPYRDEPTINDQQPQNLPQVSQDEIIPHILEDLQFAVQNARSAYPNPQETKFRITRRGAAAILADVYLWKASGENYPQDSIDYENCISACNVAYNTNETPSRVTGTATYSFYAPWDGTGSYSSIFEGGSTQGDSYSSPSSEIIFALESNQNTFGQQEAGANKTGTYMAINQLYGSVGTSGTRGDLATHYLVAPNDNYPTVSGTAIDFSDVNTSVFKVTQANGSQGDTRYTYCSGESGNSYLIGKYEGGGSAMVASVNNYPDWIFYRVSDVYLMKAEAQAEKMNCRFEYRANESGESTIQFLNFVENPGAYEDSMEVAFELCKTIFDRANQASMRTNYQTYATQQLQTAPYNYIPALVYAERRREFLFEGKRWFDLLRIARRDCKRATAGGQTITQGMNSLVTAVRTKLDEGADLIASRLASMDALYWPVYDDELDRNPALVQNAYYLSTEESDDMEIQ